tara:strand:- start:19 stop:174 length:156 start_codon:yes stop_codon:yes gene_type:complete
MTKTKKDIKHYFEIFWPQVDEGFKKVMVKDIMLIIDDKFDARKVEWNERNK